MDKYPSRSKLMKFEIIENGDKVKLDFSNEGHPDAHVTLEYSLLGEAIAFLIAALGQSIGIRAQAGKELISESGKIPAQPITVGPFQMHVADDKSHVLLDFQSPHGLSLQFAMPPKQAEGIAHKILSDLKIYPSPDKRH